MDILIANTFVLLTCLSWTTNAATAMLVAYWDWTLSFTAHVPGMLLLAAIGAISWRVAAALSLRPSPTPTSDLEALTDTQGEHVYNPECPSPAEPCDGDCESCPDLCVEDWDSPVDPCSECGNDCMGCRFDEPLPSEYADRDEPDEASDEASDSEIPF